MRSAREAREQAKKRIRRRQKAPKTASQIASRIIRPKLAAYQPDYPNNPIYAVLTELVQKAQLDLGKDERAYLADLLAEGLSSKVGASGLGAAVGLRIQNFIKGRFRDDVYGS